VSGVFAATHEPRLFVYRGGDHAFNIAIYTHLCGFFDPEMACSSRSGVVLAYGELSAFPIGRGDDFDCSRLALSIGCVIDSDNGVRRFDRIEGFLPIPEGSPMVTARRGLSFMEILAK
jgi:hypothetical protein